MIDKIAPAAPVQQVSIVQKLDAPRQQDAYADEQHHDSAHNTKPDFTSLVKKLEPHADSENQSVMFSVDDATKKMIVRVVNNDTKEVIRQYPAEELLRISRMVAHAQQQEQGNITDARI